MKYVPFPDVVWFQEGPGVKNTQYTETGVKLLNVANLIDGKVDISNTNRYISEEEAYGKYKHFLVDKGDLIIASSGIKVEYFDRKMGFVDESQLPLCMNTSTIRFKALDKSVLDIRYFMYFLKSDCFKAQLGREITGSAQLNFGPSHLKKMKLPLIDIQVQQHIASVLDKVTDLISQRRAQLDKLDLLVKSRFVEMFGDLTINNKNWHFEPLGTLCDVRDGTHDSPQYIGTGYPLLTSKNFTSGNIDFTNCNMISKEDFDKINQRSKVDNGDIIMPMIGTIGSPVIVNTETPFAIKNVALIKFQHAKISNVFIREILCSDYFQTSTMAANRGGTQKFIALGDIRKLPIPVVSSDLQAQFNLFVKQKESVSQVLLKGLDQLEVLKKSLMQQYFE